MTTTISRATRVLCVSALYLSPPGLGQGISLASDAPTNRFYVDGLCRDFKSRTAAKGGHPDFDHPSAADQGLAGSYTAGLVMPFPYVNGKLGKGIVENDPLLDWRDESAQTPENVLGLSAVRGSLVFAACGTLSTSTGCIVRGWSMSGIGWTVVHTPSPNRVMSDIDMVNDRVGWAIGLTGGYVVRTPDGGASWDPQITEAGALNLSVSAVDVNTAFISSNAGRVFRTSDAGLLWQPVDTGAGATNLLGVCFVDALTGWAVGANGSISRTSDGGDSWTVSNPVAVPLRGIWARDANTVWVVGNAGTILRTTDAGATWVPQASGTAVHLNGVTFADDGEYGLAAGNGGVMLVTYDGGSSWQPLGKVSGTTKINDVVYVTDPPRQGVGYSGYATGYASLDGGKIKRRRRAGVQVAAEWTHVSSSTEARQMLDVPAGDAAGLHHAPHCASITDPVTMEPWFIDVPGVNLSTTLSFQFDRQGVGPSSYFLFDDPDFYPIDDQLFGNPPGEHNYLFTVEGDWIFDRDASRTEWLFVESNGDAWVYIDDRLVIDMGGIHGVTRQYVDIDRLGLTDGTTYNLKIFVAERQAGVPYQLMIATNVYLKNAGGLSVTEMAD